MGLGAGMQVAKKLLSSTWKLLVQPAIQHLLLRPCSKTTEGNETPIGMVATTDGASEMFHAVMTILLEEVLGFHLRPDFFDSSTELLMTDRVYDTMQIGINLPLGIVQRLEWRFNVEQLGNRYYGYQEGFYVAKAVMDAAYNDSGMVLEHYKTYNAESSNLQKYFGSLSDFSPSELLECSESTVWTFAEAMRYYAQFSGDYEGEATCHDGHWWIAPSCRGNVSMCIPVLTFDDNLLYAMMLWAAAYGMPFGIANFARRELYQNHDPERSRSLFYRGALSVEFLKFSPEPLLVPRHNANEWSQGNQRTAPADHAAAHFASSNLERALAAHEFDVVHHFLTTLRLEGREIQSLLVELHGSLSQPFADRDGQRAVACRWVRENRATWFWVHLGYKTNCTNGSGLVNGNNNYVSSRAEAVDCRGCYPGQHSEALTDSLGTTFRCTLHCEAPFVASLTVEWNGEPSCLCPAGVADLEDLKLFERIL